MVAVTHVSNALGTINPVGEIIPWRTAPGALALVDGAQAAPHLKVDVMRWMPISTRFQAIRWWDRPA